MHGLPSKSGEAKCGSPSSHRRIRQKVVKPTKGQHRAETTTASCHDCAGPVTAARCDHGNAASCKLLHVDRSSVDWPFLHHQFHGQAPQFTLPILWKSPTLRTYRRNSVQDLRRLATAIFCVFLVILQDARAEVVSVAIWNLEWFPGGNPNSSQSERLIHMSAAPDILCLQEVRDWDSVAELVSILGRNFQTLVVSRFREMGSSGPLSIQQTAVASKSLRSH